MSSYWISTTKEEKIKSDSLKDREVDICIIGGGLTGLSCAYYLTKQAPEKNIIILEKEELCQHASGHTTAKITSQHGLFYQYLVESKGIEYAKSYLMANENSIKRIKEIIKEENIECNLEEQSAYVYTQEEGEIQKIKEEVKVVKQLGFTCDFKTQIEVPIEIKAAIEFPNQACFHPRKYILGLATAIQKNGGKIIERTKVIKVEKEKEKYKIETEDGKEILAKYVVIATHYPIVNIPGFYFMKMYQSMSYAIMIKTQNQLDGMYITSKEPTVSFRPFQDGQNNYIIIGGSDHKTGSKIDLSDSYVNLEKEAKKLYPDSEVIARWNTEDCITLDKIPYIGEFSEIMPHMYVGTGYNKWGMTSSNIAGKIISDMILENKNEEAKIFKATRVEPIKNRKEVENMLKETTYSLVINKLKLPQETLESLKKEEGKIVEVDGEKVGVYQDENGKIYMIKPICTHLGCELAWNNLDKTWDCPCHGSRFTIEGKLLSEPALKDLENGDLK